MQPKTKLARQLECLEERALLAAVNMVSVTETDARTLSLTYQVAPNPPATLEVDFFRAPTNSPVQGQEVPIGSTILSGSQLTPGTHKNEAISLPNNTNGPDPLSPDPKNKFVFASAQEPSGPPSTASFEKLVFAAVTHGYEFFSSSTPPTWVSQIATALDAEGYLPVIPFNWSDTSGLGKPNQGTNAGDKLAGQIVTEMQGLVKAGTIPANAVVDIVLIAHSRGSVVISRVAQDLSNELGQIPNAKGGYWRLTYLDPHPSHFEDIVHLAADSGIIGQKLLSHAESLQTQMQDPFPLEVPAQVADVQDYFETHLTSQAPAHSDGSYINPWGTSRGQGGFKFDSTSTEYHEFQLTAPGISHSEVHDWYQLNVVPLLGKASTIVTFPNDALLRATANDVGAKVGQPTSYDYVATFTDDDPTASDASKYSATINWGDGTSSTGQVSANLIEAGFTVYATHVYSSPGTFTFIVTITDLGGTQDNGGSVAVVQGTAKIKLTSLVAQGAPAGAIPLVSLVDPSTGQVQSQIPAFPASVKSGVQVALGDVNDDGTPDVVAAAAIHGRPIVRVFDGVDHHLIAQFSAPGAGRSGAFVTTADFNHDGRAEVVVGSGGQVRVFDGTTGAPLFSTRVRSARGVRGVPVAAVDVNGDRFVDVVAGGSTTSAPSVIDGRLVAARMFQLQLARLKQEQLLLVLQGLRTARRHR